MLDQNITSLLSTLLGGLLAITGGFIATHYNLIMSRKAETKALMRSKIEEIYALMNKADKINFTRQRNQIITHYLKDPIESLEFYIKYHDELTDNMDKMSLIIDLYLPDLYKGYLAYVEAVADLEKGISDARLEDVDELTMFMEKYLRLVSNTQFDMKRTLVKLAKRYS